MSKQKMSIIAETLKVSKHSDTGEIVIRDRNNSIVANLEADAYHCIYSQEDKILVKQKAKAYAKLFAAAPKMLLALKVFAETKGVVSIDKGIAHFEDGSSLSLWDIIKEAQ